MQVLIRFRQQIAFPLASADLQHSFIPILDKIALALAVLLLLLRPVREKALRAKKRSLHVVNAHFEPDFTKSPGAIWNSS
ncbi:MAG: hypothetical protein IBX49_04650 [Gammaproteobacteria bacterium]|nr:hypothetical protein [Gammaproteobacteria bacterium]